MMNKLKKLFPSLRINEEVEDLHADYKWYTTQSNEIIGISEDELTNKDKLILSAFLQPYDTNFPRQTEREIKWRKRIFEDHMNEINSFNHRYRFVHFHIDQSQIDPITFKEAITQLFAKEIAIIWENEREGIIVEEVHENEEPISYTQIIDLLMSDLYVKISFFVGQFQHSIKQIKSYYHSVISSANIAIQYAKTPVTTYLDIIPYILIDQADEKVRYDICSILKELQHDDETLKMIETFINCNLNISETAKQLYMHRNSLQYRLDKLIEITNIDIRQFHDAMAAYFALLSIKQR